MIIREHSLISDELRAFAGAWQPIDREKKPVLTSAMEKFSEKQPCNSQELLDEINEAIRICPKTEAKEDLPLLLQLRSVIERVRRQHRAKQRLSNSILAAYEANVSTVEIRGWIDGIFKDNIVASS